MEFLDLSKNKCLLGHSFFENISEKLPALQTLILKENGVNVYDLEDKKGLSPQKHSNDFSKILITGIDDLLTKTEIKDHFTQFGAVKSVDIEEGIVEFKSPKPATHLIENEKITFFEADKEI